jgi:hypothetical protein
VTFLPLNGKEKVCGHGQMTTKLDCAPRNLEFTDARWIVPAAMRRQAVTNTLRSSSSRQPMTMAFTTGEFRQYLTVHRVIHGSATTVWPARFAIVRHASSLTMPCISTALE